MRSATVLKERQEIKYVIIMKNKKLIYSNLYVCLLVCFFRNHAMKRFLLFLLCIISSNSSL